jgi:hypothetical protein
VWVADSVHPCGRASWRLITNKARGLSYPVVSMSVIRVRTRNSLGRSIAVRHLSKGVLNRNAGETKRKPGTVTGETFRESFRSIRITMSEGSKKG